MDIGAAQAAEATVIDRRSMLAAGATLALDLVLPAGCLAMQASPILDVIDLSVWEGEGRAPARILIGAGAYLRSEQVEKELRSRLLTALLSPANAELFREYLRFERGVIVQEQPFATTRGALLMTASRDSRVASGSIDRRRVAHNV
jgi:hypothetical protein